MKMPTAIVKEMALNGTLLIPAAVRDAMGWDSGSAIAIYAFEDFLVLKSAPEKNLLVRELTELAQGMTQEKLEQVVKVARYYAK